MSATRVREDARDEVRGDVHDVPGDTMVETLAPAVVQARTSSPARPERLRRNLMFADAAVVTAGFGIA